MNFMNSCNYLIYITLIVEYSNMESSSKNKKRVIFIILGCLSALLLLTILYFLEKGIYCLCKLVLYYWPLALLMLICLHLLFIRYVVLVVAFAGRSRLITRPMKYMIGVAQANGILKEINNLIFSIGILKQNRGDSLMEKISFIKQTFNSNYNIYMYYIDIFKRMNDKFHSLTKEQQILMNNMMLLKETIDESKILNFLEEKGNIDHPIKIEDREMIFDTFLDRMLLNIEIIIHLLEEYSNKDVKYYEAKRYQNIFYDDLFNSLNQNRIELEDTFEFDEYKLKTNDNNMIDYIIIKGNKEEAEQSNTIALHNTTLMFICGPNGASFEYFAKNIRLGTYLSKGIDVLCWNYRGFGYSSGTPTFDNLRSDVIELFDQVDKLGIYNKYGVHGISIGGIPACYLANKKKISLLVSDRNFGAMDLIANALPFGNILYCLYKMLILPSSTTVNDFINAKCYKIVLNDPKDTIVKESSSIKTTVSKYITNHYLKVVTKQSSNSLELLDTRIVSNNVDQVNNNSNLDGLDLLLENKSNKKMFINILTEIGERLRENNIDGKGEYGFFDKCIMIIKCKRGKYYNLKEEDLQNNSGLFDFIKNKLTELLDMIESAGDTLYSVVLLKEQRQKKMFIKNFFSNLIVWGIQENVEHFDDLYHFSTVNIHRNITDAIEFLDSFLSSQELQGAKEQPIIQMVVTLRDLFKIMSNNIKCIEVKKNSHFLPAEDHLNTNTNLVNNKAQNEAITYEDSLNAIGRGHLIGLRCGHNGPLNYEEYSSFQYQIERSGFTNISNNII